LRLLGQPSGRSVDSQCQSRVMEPRNYLSWRAFVVRCAGAVSTGCKGLVRWSAGVREQGKDTPGFPGNLGDPEPLQTNNFRSRGPDDEPLARGWAFGTAGSESTDAAFGIAKRRQRSAAKGSQGVAQRRSTWEAGELAPEGPVEGRALPTGGSRGGNQGEHTEAPNLVTGTPRVSFRGVWLASAEVKRPHCKSVRGRTGCVNCARPDLWEGWEATPTLTRRIIFVPLWERIRAGKKRVPCANRDEPEFTNSARHRPLTASLKSPGET